jgi:hypothetical protein
MRLAEGFIGAAGSVPSLDAFDLVVGLFRLGQRLPPLPQMPLFLSLGEWPR